MNAIDFCKKLDNELGEIWSNDYQELPQRMDEYAKLYHEQQLKILNIPVVSQQRELLVAYDNFKLITPLSFSCSEECIDAFMATNSG